MELKSVKIKLFSQEYKKIVKIYKSSFPKAERFPVLLLRLMTRFKSINSFAYYDENVLCGFAYFLVNRETVFILYLAVNDKIRSQGYGSRILSWIKAAYPNKTVFLDSEKPDKNAVNNHLRLKRTEFYRRNGIYQTGNYFTHRGITYEILCTDKNFGIEDYNKNLMSYLNFFPKKQ